MAKFVLVTEAQNDLIFNRVEEAYGSADSFKVSDTLILIHSSAELTADQVVSRIDQNHTDAPLKSIGVKFVVFSITSYQGWHLNSMWTWLNSKGF